MKASSRQPRRVIAVVLYGCKVTDAGLEHVKALASLKTLWPQGTQVTDTGVNELNKALSNLRISR